MSTPGKDAMRILIVKPSSIGDVIHTFPSAALARAAFPEARISWVVKESLADVVGLAPCVDRVVCMPRPGISAARHFINDLRSERYDIAIDYQGLLRSGIACMLSGAPKRIGFAHAREGSPFFYTEKLVIENLHSHAVDKNIMLTRFALGIDPGLEPPAKALAVPESRLANSLLGGSNGAPVLSVCFSSRWPSKNWPGEFIAGALKEAAARLPGLKVLLIGSDSDRAYGDEIAAAARLEGVENLSGRTGIGDLAAVLAGSSAMFTVDSGPMHLAAALGVPCIAMFGATDSVLTGPYGPPGLHTVIRSKCSLSPCLHRECPRSARCSEGIEPSQAAEAIANAIYKHSPRNGA